LQCGTVGAFAVDSDQTPWFLHGWDVGLAHGPPDKIVDLEVTSHPTEGKAKRLRERPWVLPFSHTALRAITRNAKS